MLRQAAVAGVFYPADAGSVIDFIEKNKLDTERVDAQMLVVPHAGYIYSGAVAVRAISSINIPDTVILAGPNHTGDGTSISVYPDGAWATPLGDVSVDTELVDKICESQLFKKDTQAHQSEHSLEVILPILKYFNPKVNVVLITAKYQNLETIRKAAEHIASVSDTLLIVSSDFNHFENADITEQKDKLALDKLMKMDAKGLYDIIVEKRISMCGVVPACMGIIYSQKHGSKEPVFIEHTHSGVVNGDNSRVVGYAGLYYKKEVFNEG